mmetsp:Transcript_11173/g.20319  ORF Transcript_11173/g.20319 Transcript_11173/m.20319 type:complete len:240 (-) Transcript_11173:1013-1732(-)
MDERSSSRHTENRLCIAPGSLALPRHHQSSGPSISCLYLYTHQRHGSRTWHWHLPLEYLQCKHHRCKYRFRSEHLHHHSHVHSQELPQYTAQSDCRTCQHHDRHWEKCTPHPTPGISPQGVLHKGHCYNDPQRCRPARHRTQCRLQASCTHTCRLSCRRCRPWCMSRMEDKPPGLEDNSSQCQSIRRSSKCRSQCMGTHPHMANLVDAARRSNCRTLFHNTPDQCTLSHSGHPPSCVHR